LGPNCQSGLKSLTTTSSTGRAMKRIKTTRSTAPTGADPWVYVDGVATGLPVVATRVGDNPELMMDESTGFLVGPRSPAALAASLRRYLEDPTLLAQHGRAASEHAEAEFSLERMVKAYERLYGWLLGTRRR